MAASMERRELWPSEGNPTPSQGVLSLFDNTSLEEKLLNPRYKTEICRNFKERSRCVYGDKCQFAHGRRELRDVVRNSKYKTKLCQKYWLVGYCAYGPRCNFLHDELNTDDLDDYPMQTGTESVIRSATPTNILDINAEENPHQPQSEEL